MKTVNEGIEFIKTPPRVEESNEVTGEGGIEVAPKALEPKGCEESAIDRESGTILTPDPNIMKNLKRVLSPDEETKLGRIRKQSTEEDCSHALKERKLDLKRHGYEMFKKNTAGEVST